MSLNIKTHIVLGMTGSLTGKYRLQGRQTLAGAQAWVRDANRNGGIRVRNLSSRIPIRLLYYDDRSDTKRCQAFAELLIQEHRVDILLGPYSSGLSLRAALVAEKHNRILWNQGGASERIYDSGKGWVVGILTPDSRYFHGVIDFATALNPSGQSVAIVHSTAGAFPREVASGAEIYCRMKGFHSVKVLTYGAGTEDFSPILERLERDPPDLLLGVGRIEDDLRFAQQYVLTNLRLRMVSLVAAGIERFGEEMGSLSESFWAPSQWEPEAVAEPEYGPGTQLVLNSLSRQGDLPIDYPMAQAYAGCLVAQRCIEEAGTLDNDELRAVAGRLDFTTFFGRFRIDSVTGRQLGHAMTLVQWQSGKKVVVCPKGAKY